MRGCSGWFLLSFSVKNAQQNLPCLLRALPAAPPATRGPTTLPRNKCSLMTTAKTKCLCFVSSPALSHPFLGVEAGKDPGAEARPCCPAQRRQGGREGWAQFTASSEEKLPPLPISVANSVLRHQPCPCRQTRCCPPLPLHARRTNAVGRKAQRAAVRRCGEGMLVGFGSVLKVTLLERSRFFLF